MDYCDGGDLNDLLLQSGKKFAEDDAVRYFKQACLGYSELNNNGIIHRDLKPHNMMLN